MELKVFRDTLSSTAMLCECKAEIPIEVEILVPDYLPQIFKIVKCFVSLVPLHQQVSGGKLVVEGYLRCTVYYQAEENQSLCQTEHKLPFTKTMDIPEGNVQNHSVQITGETEYLNCRAVNQRRIDLRGAFGLAACINTQDEQEIITALADCGIEQKLIPVSSTKTLLSLDKLLTAEDDIVFPRQPEAILDIAGLGNVQEVKLISGKAVVKGNIDLCITYRSDSGCCLENIEKSVPFNQIIDLEGIPEDSISFAHVEMTGCTLMAGNSQENGGTATVNALLHLRIHRPTECYVVSDAFSTRYEVQLGFSHLLCERICETMDQSSQVKISGTMPDENAQIIGCFVTMNPPELQKVPEGVSIGGRAIAHVMCLNSLNEIDCYDKTFEYQFPSVYKGSTASYRLECWTEVVDAAASKNGSEMQLQVTLRLLGLLFLRISENIVTDAACTDELENGEPNVALRIFYAQAGENIFEIAKRYHVSPSAMMKLNELEDLELTSDQRLLIPMTV